MANFDILYINLDTATERRLSFEESFRASNFSSTWALNRFEAIKSSSEAVQQGTGPAAPALRANWLSHVGAAKAAVEMGLTSHILIAEDDTAFCPATEFWVKGLVTYLGSYPWDVLYLDACISNAVDMPWFFKLRYKCFRESRVDLIPLEGFRRSFAGAGAYVVNNASLGKFISLTDTNDFYCAAFDLHLRRLVCEGKLNAFMTFPFLTTVASCADDSQVQVTTERLTEDVLMNAFRRMVWIGAGEPNHERQEEDSVITKEVKAFQEIFSPLLTMQLGWHY